MHPCVLANDGDPAVAEITWESPGEAKIKKDKAEIKKAEYGDYAKAGGGSMALDEPLNVVASFTINPVAPDGETEFDPLKIAAVCIENATFFSDPAPTNKVKGEGIPLP